MNRIEWKKELHLLSKKKKKIYHISSLCMKFMVSIGQIQSPQFKMRGNSPLVANGYPLSGGNLI